MNIHVWVPELMTSKGGIQVFSSHLLQALGVLVGPEHIRVMSKTDTGQPDKAAPGMEFYGSGRWPVGIRTPVFAARVIADAWRCGPDLVIATHLNFAVAARWLNTLKQIPYWCVVHGIEAWGLTRRDRIEALRGADRILAVSSYTRGRLLDELELDPAKVGLLPNTFNSDIFVPGPKPAHLLRLHGIEASQKIILTVGRLVEPERYKGYDRIIRALPSIRQSIPDVHYVLVGKGPDRGRIEDLVRELGVGDLVTLAGYVSDAELVDYYNLCDVFAMPSKGEGFGIVYLEAMSCGKPVLAGDGDGSRDPLEGGELGVLVDADNEKEIADSLVRILNGTYPLPILYRPEELRARVVSAFDFQRFSAALAQHLSTFAMSRNLPFISPVASQTPQTDNIGLR